MLLDRLANHPNVGPFVGKQSIERRVISNPSPAYVQRVAAKFNDNGSGVRGDLEAVLKAILLDTEARSAASPRARTSAIPEPVLPPTHMMRALGAKWGIQTKSFYGHTAQAMRYGHAAALKMLAMPRGIAVLCALQRISMLQRTRNAVDRHQGNVKGRGMKPRRRYICRNR